MLNKINKLIVSNTILLMTVIAFVSYVLGYVGYEKYFVANSITHTSFDLLYHSLQLFLFGFYEAMGPFPLELEISRWVSPLIFASAAIKTVFVFAKDAITVTKAKRMKEHVIICGLGEKGYKLAKDCIGHVYSLIIIEQDRDNKYIRSISEQGALVLYGSAVDRVLLDSASVSKAKYLICVTGEDETNIEVASLLYQDEKFRDNGNFLEALVHVGSRDVKTYFYEKQLFAKDFDGFSARLFNIYEIGARVLLDENGPDRFVKSLSTKTGYFDITIVGDNLIANELMLHTVRVGHYSESLKLSVNLVGHYSEEWLGTLDEKHPNIQDVAKFSLHNISLEEVQNRELIDCIANTQAEVIYVCVDSEIQGMRLAQKIINTITDKTISVVVIVNNSTNLSHWIRDIDNIYVFDLLKHSCTFDTVINTHLDNKAKKIHSYYVNNELARGETKESNSSLVPWKELHETLKDANRHQADHISIKLRAIGLDSDDIGGNKNVSFSELQIETLAKIEHNRWAADKIIGGWKYTSGEKDSDKKLSPCLVPWDELSEEDKDKDRDTIKNIPNILKNI